MLLKHLTTSGLIAACLLQPLSCLAQDKLKNPAPGQSIGDFIASLLNDTNDILRPSNNIDSNSSVVNITPRQASEIVPSPSPNQEPYEPTAEPAVQPAIQSLGKPRRIGPPVGRKPLTASWNTTDVGESGYKLTIPSNLCASTVVGDWKTPSGEMAENCTLAQMYQKIESSHGHADQLHGNSGIKRGGKAQCHSLIRRVPAFQATRPRVTVGLP